VRVLKGLITQESEAAMFSISEMIPMQQRKSRAKTADDHASLFIRKAYHAVSNCPEHIGDVIEK
jgi:hypothetical protein